MRIKSCPIQNWSKTPKVEDWILGKDNKIDKYI